MHGVIIGRATFDNPWIFRRKEAMKRLLNAGKDPAHSDLADAAPTREERLLMALEHSYVHARLKGEEHFVELCKHMGWYLGHFPGAKHIRNELVRINSLADVEEIICTALVHPEHFDSDSVEVPEEELHDSELDATCTS
jgi:tRNA-dihydrouridine synthase